MLDKFTKAQGLTLSNYVSGTSRGVVLQSPIAGPVVLYIDTEQKCLNNKSKTMESHPSQWEAKAYGFSSFILYK